MRLVYRLFVKPYTCNANNAYCRCCANPINKGEDCLAIYMKGQWLVCLDCAEGLSDEIKTLVMGSGESDD